MSDAPARNDAPAVCDDCGDEMTVVSGERPGTRTWRCAACETTVDDCPGCGSAGWLLRSDGGVRCQRCGEVVGR